MTAALLGPDHVDLLVSAADRWGVLSLGEDLEGRAGDGRDVVSVATLQSAGVAVVHALMDASRLRCPELGEVSRDALGYRVVLVKVLEPVEVLKAAHRVEVMAAGVPGWWGSVAQRLVSGIARAAAERVEGYDAAPDVWTRPLTRAGSPVGVGTGWRPELPGLEWLDVVADLAGRWESAALVVVTAEAVAGLPAHLPRRAGVFVIADRAPDDAVWDGIARLAPEAVLWWPSNLAWLVEQLRAPAAAFTQYRPAHGDPESGTARQVETEVAAADPTGEVAEPVVGTSAYAAAENH